MKDFEIAFFQKGKQFGEAEKQTAEAPGSLWRHLAGLGVLLSGGLGRCRTWAGPAGR